MFEGLSPDEVVTQCNTKLAAYDAKIDRKILIRNTKDNLLTSTYDRKGPLVRYSLEAPFECYAAWQVTQNFRLFTRSGLAQVVENSQSPENTLTKNEIRDMLTWRVFCLLGKFPNSFVIEGVDILFKNSNDDQLLEPVSIINSNVKAGKFRFTFIKGNNSFLDNMIVEIDEWINVYRRLVAGSYSEVQQSVTTLRDTTGQVPKLEEEKDRLLRRLAEVEKSILLRNLGL